MRIGLDVMGGDYAPGVTVSGAIAAYSELGPDSKLVLIGDEKAILDLCQKERFDSSVFDIVDAPETIGMGDHPAKAFAQKASSSIRVGYELLSKGLIDGFASAGNTGAMMVGAMYTVKQIPGVLRPAISTFPPRIDGKLNVLLDVGLNADCKPDVLFQYGILGSLYAEFVHEVKNPRVALLNIGEEEEKGDLLSKSTYALMKGTKEFNFIGNVEGRDLFSDKADVIVCDGFVGNVILKEAEAFYFIAKKLGFSHPFFDKINPDIHGGTPILGINANVIVGHGSSGPVAIKNMVLLTEKIIHAELPRRIKNSFSVNNEQN